ncbi:hypothetical protein HHK36_009805 [Tetracentron sinense]|uniref:Uncharacterized protein n=1 Tax=Tetracentron sinense TaxID=13715 RepID=A0A834ZFV2_TETSI|nr:hypothetical protein HHK36_009805 [Tetracentron sinense]
MGRLLKPYEKESIKMAMLKHEEIFKEQVYELHRLYQIQKMLMDTMIRSGHNGCSRVRRNLENEINLREVNCSYREQQKPRRKIDLEQPAEGYVADGDGVLEIEDESCIELTLGPSSYNQRKKDETPLNSDSGLSFSSSSAESSHVRGTSTGTHKRTGREQLTGHEWGLTQLLDMNLSFQSGRKTTFDVGRIIQTR